MGKIDRNSSPERMGTVVPDIKMMLDTAKGGDEPATLFTGKRKGSQKDLLEFPVGNKNAFRRGQTVVQKQQQTPRGLIHYEEQYEVIQEERNDLVSPDVMYRRQISERESQQKSISMMPGESGSTGMGPQNFKSASNRL